MIADVLDADNKTFASDDFVDMVLETNQREIEELLNEIADRECEALEIFEPMPSQQAFLNSRHRIRVVRGGNRSGKTLVTMVETARILTGRHPDKKNANGGYFYMVGADEKHIGDPMWKTLASWGPFKMIRDPVTQKWRAFSFQNRYDKENIHLAKPAPPLIPPRFIPKDGVGWLKKRQLIPRQVHFTTGWILNCFSSLSRVPKGFKCHWGLFDEEIEGEEWFPEMMRGLTDEGGRFIWGATPQAQTEKLFELHERANDPNEKDVGEFILFTLNNAHISEEQKQNFHDDLSPAERGIRLKGDFALSDIKVYPEFDEFGAHGIDSFRPPPDWTIYIVVDPGVQVCAVLFVAVPPETYVDKGETKPKYIHFFDELYLRRADPELCAQRTKQIMGDQYPHAVLIDHQMGRQTDVGSGKTVEWQYLQEFKKAEIFAPGYVQAFIPGSTDVHGREQAFRAWLKIRGSTGDAALRIHHRCEMMKWEIKKQRYKAKTNRSERVRKNDHLVNCAEYIADLGPQWHSPPKKNPVEPGWMKARKALQEFHHSEDVSMFISLGPTGE